MNTYNPNATTAVKYAINLLAVNRESYLIKGSLYSMRETLLSLSSDVTSETQSEKDMGQVWHLYHEAREKIDQLNKLVGLIKSKEDYNKTGYFNK
jgi:hypothetical protein